MTPEAQLFFGILSAVVGGATLVALWIRQRRQATGEDPDDRRLLS